MSSLLCWITHSASLAEDGEHSQMLFLRHYLFVFFRQDLILAWNLPGRLGCLSRGHQGCTFGSLPSTRITSTSHIIINYYYYLIWILAVQLVPYLKGKYATISSALWVSLESEDHGLNQSSQTDSEGRIWQKDYFYLLLLLFLSKGFT